MKITTEQRVFWTPGTKFHDSLSSHLGDKSLILMFPLYEICDQWQ
jgi:hypothetical protein